MDELTLSERRKGKGNPFYGKKHTKEWKEELIKRNKKRILSGETKKKIGEAHKGKKHTEETRRKIGLANSREKCPFWRGGITSINQKLRETIEVKLWKEAVFERDKFLCQMPCCDRQEHYLNAHHIKTWAKCLELRDDINNGITLCKKCHRKTFKKEEHFEELFLAINKLKQ
uniref:Homing endonuclease n=1 Tax=viral metagenome TaxID=1070528 RepID=A0A6H1ZPU7_9ZZZZ